MIKCKNCIFWKEETKSVDNLFAGQREEGTGKGQCRRFPPQITHYSSQVWPITRKYDYCGEGKSA